MIEERYSQGMKILFYVLAVVFPVVGIIIGIVLMTKEDEESKALGKNVLIVGIVVAVLACCCIAALLGLQIAGLTVFGGESYY